MIQCIDPLLCEDLQNGNSKSVIPSFFFFSIRILPLKETYCDLPFGYPRTELIQEKQGKCAFFLILFLSIFKITSSCFCNTLSSDQFIFVVVASIIMKVHIVQSVFGLLWFAGLITEHITILGTKPGFRSLSLASIKWKLNTSRLWLQKGRQGQHPDALSLDFPMHCVGPVCLILCVWHPLSLPERLWSLCVVLSGGCGACCLSRMLGGSTFLLLVPPGGRHVILVNWSNLSPGLGLQSGARRGTGRPLVTGGDRALRPSCYMMVAVLLSLYLWSPPGSWVFWASFRLFIGAVSSCYHFSRSLCA